MSFKSRLDFILHLTNWFGGRYEPDAGGPEGPLDQLLTGLVIRAWAGNLQDVEARQLIFEVTEKVISKNAQGVATIIE